MIIFCELPSVLLKCNCTLLLLSSVSTLHLNSFKIYKIVGNGYRRVIFYMTQDPSLVVLFLHVLYLITIVNFILLPSVSNLKENDCKIQSDVIK